MDPAAGSDRPPESDPAPALSLLLTLDAGERVSGTIGMPGTGTSRTFHGWVDLISTIEALRATTDGPHPD